MGEYNFIKKCPHCRKCDDFYYSVISGTALACSHLIAQKLAAAMFNYKINYLSDTEYADLIRKLRDSTLNTMQKFTVR